MKKAFTLAETLITLGIIGVLAGVSMGMLSSNNPNSDMLMFRKAYNITTNAVYSILQSGAYYEEGVLSDTSNTPVNVNGAQVQGDTKFCQVFASIVNAIDAPVCPGVAWDAPSFTTADGVAWYIPSSRFAVNATISVDVNGDSRPNCLAGAADCNHPDRFEIQITPEGKVNVNNARAREYLTNRSNIIKR